MTTKPFLAITAFVVVLLATGTYMAIEGPSDTQVATRVDALPVAVTPTAKATTLAETTVISTPTVSRVIPAVEVAPTTSLYKDGTYIASGTYGTPEGRTETIKVSITFKNDAIVDSNVTPTTANDRESERYQKQFIAGYKQLVIGKKITEVKLSLVSGSSLTSLGWNKAVASIALQAKA